jgi:hypothetical protein
MASRPASPPGRIEDVAVGQKMIIGAIVVNVTAVILSRTVHPAFAWLVIVSAVLAIVGLLRLSDGLGYSAGKKALLIIASFIPLVSLIMLLLVNQRANEALKNAGYKVGLLGAKKS